MANEGSREMMIIWDFDRTIITEDCDRWVVLETDLTKLFHRVRVSLDWIQIIDRMMDALHAQGKTINDFVDRLNKFTIDPQMISAIRSAHELGYLLNHWFIVIYNDIESVCLCFRCEMKVLSNANQFFIETILKNNGVFECFSGIISNPTVVDEEGRLRILPYNGRHFFPHGCKHCPPNLCKGIVIDKIRESDTKKRGIIYIGDGKDDFCPVMKLTEEDHVMPKEKLILYYILTLTKLPVNPKIHAWKDGEQLENNLVRLLSPQPEVLES
ncbi:putative inorganic diphosphatase [Helianthus annuus]|nr:putative inorganic diphosphatase [Helianthus annuus]